MLTGVFLFLFGIGLGLNSVSLVLVFTPLYVLMNVWELKRIEEPELVKRPGRRVHRIQTEDPDVCSSTQIATEVESLTTRRRRSAIRGGA